MNLTGIRNKKLRKNPSVVSIFLALTLLIISSIVAGPLHSAATGAVSRPQSQPSWIVAGAYLNYSVNGNLAAVDSLGNGSKMSVSESIAGTLKVSINGVSGNQVSITTTPNVVYKGSMTAINGSTQSQSGAAIPANSTQTTNVNLNQFSFGNEMQQLTSLANSSYGFSPEFNVTLSKNPGALYPFNSTTNYVALALNSSLSEHVTMPQQIGSGGTFSINGTMNSFTSLLDNIPLKITYSFVGTASLSSIGGIGVGGAPGLDSGTVSANFGATIQLLTTNIVLPTGNANQGVVSIPNLSASPDVLSNSTITGAGTSGNQLVVNVTGPSGTHGVLEVIISPSMLTKAGIDNVSQVQVTEDGQAYSNYTVSQLGGSYIFTIYYHHSSHSIGMTFGHANLGNNQASISSIAPSATPNTILGMSTTEVLVFAVVVIFVVIGAIAFAMMRRKKQAPTTPEAVNPPAPTAGPSMSPDGSTMPPSANPS